MYNVNPIFTFCKYIADLIQDSGPQHAIKRYMCRNMLSFYIHKMIY